jgi:hypothetical protein
LQISACQPTKEDRLKAACPRNRNSGTFSNRGRFLPVNESLDDFSNYGMQTLGNDNLEYLTDLLVPIDATAMARVSRFLEEAEITACDWLPRGSNRVFIVKIVKENAAGKAIYKPRRGETPLYDFPEGSLYKREYAAYLVSQALEWFIVPPTVIRHGPWGVGSVQWFVNSHHRLISESKTGVDVFNLKRVALFDYVVNNADRKLGHFLEGRDGHLWVVDHGLTFNAQPKLRTVLWDFAGQPIPGKFVADIAALRQKLAPENPLRNILLRWLDKAEIQALEARINRIIANPVFIHPESRWSVPWPWI